MLALGDCWPYNKINAEAASHVLQTETYRRASFADVGAVVSSAVAMDGLSASYFNADAVSVAQFGVVIADVLRAATVQIDNVVAVNFYGLDEGNDGVDAIHSGTVARGSVIHFDVAIHYWPAGATVLETPGTIAQALLDALVAPTPTAFQKALDLYGTDPQFCDGCVLSSGVLNVVASQYYIDEFILDGLYVVTSSFVDTAARRDLTFCGSYAFSEWTNSFGNPPTGGFDYAATDPITGAGCRAITTTAGANAIWLEDDQELEDEDEEYSDTPSR
jgi:hypothetical protein